MRQLLKVLLLCVVVMGCTNSPDHLAKKALDQFAAEKYGSNSDIHYLGSKVFKSVLRNTDLNNKHYACIGLLRFQKIADRPYKSDRGSISPGDKVFGLVYITLRFTQGQTGVIEINSYNPEEVVSPDGAEVPKEVFDKWVSSISLE